MTGDEWYKNTQVPNIYIYFTVCAVYQILHGVGDPEECVDNSPFTWTEGVHLDLFDRFGGTDQPGILGPRWRIQSILRVLPGKMTHKLTPLKALSGPLHIL